MLLQMSFGLTSKFLRCYAKDLGTVDKRRALIGHWSDASKSIILFLLVVNKTRFGVKHLLLLSISYKLLDGHY